MVDAKRPISVSRPIIAPFRGHITLARLDGRSKPPLSELPERRWPVATFALVRSHLGGGPARYETVATWPLQP